MAARGITLWLCARWSIDKLRERLIGPECSWALSRFTQFNSLRSKNILQADEDGFTILSPKLGSSPEPDYVAAGNAPLRAL